MRTPPTAFTVNFNDKDDDNIREFDKPFSLQDAAKMAPTGRRLLRRITPALAAQNSIPLSASTSLLDRNNADNGLQSDPKHYLFKKMIQGYNKKSNEGIFYGFIFLI